MDITKRQRKILEIVVKEYIEIGEPISSHFIEINYDLGVSPATIRNDLKRLVKTKYLNQPYTSAGRVPSDKGYRYFVNKLIKKKKRLENRQLANRVRKLERKMNDEVKYLRELTGFLAGLSSALTYSYLEDNDLYWKEGFDKALDCSEFQNIEKVHSFLSLVKEFENSFENRIANNLKKGEVRIYIGKESPLGNKDFSILVSHCPFSKKKSGFLAILGPKRMAYDKNIAIINSLVKLLENGYDE